MRPIDLAGKRFGRLTVIERDYEYQKALNSKNIYWKCKCDCGNEKSIKGSHLSEGMIRSCGCLRDEELHARTREDMISALEAHEKTLVEGTNISMLNDKKQKNNKSGIKGVCFDVSRQKWVACLNLKGTKILFKRFDSKQDAVNARKEAEEKYFKPILEKYSDELGSKK